MLIGISEGITIAILSPLFAFLLGFGPALPQILPVVILGNSVIVLLWYLIAARGDNKRILRMIVSVVCAAIAKFLVLWLGVVKIVIPLLHIGNPQATVLSAAFLYPQIFTAIIGGAVSISVIIPLSKIIKKKNS